MRALPEFPLWKTARPPVTKKWLAAGSLITLLAGGGAALLRGAGRDSSTIFTLMLASLVLIALLWLCRLVYYRASLHHATTWQQAVEHEEKPIPSRATAGKTTFPPLVRGATRRK